MLDRILGFVVGSPTFSLGIILALMLSCLGGGGYIGYRLGSEHVMASITAEKTAELNQLKTALKIVQDELQKETQARLADAEASQQQRLNLQASLRTLKNAKSRPHCVVPTDYRVRFNEAIRAANDRN